MRFSAARDLLSFEIHSGNSFRMGRKFVSAVSVFPLSECFSCQSFVFSKLRQLLNELMEER